VSRADRAHNTFAHTRNDRFFGRATNESIKVRAHCDARFHFHPDAVLSDAVNRRTTHVWARGVDHFRIDARAHRFEHRLAGSFGRQIDGAGSIEVERNPCLVRSNQGENNMADIAARQVMCFQWIAPDVQTSFHGRNAVVDNQSNRHLPQTHADHFSYSDGSVGDSSPEPGCEKLEKDDREDKREQRQYRYTDKIKRFHTAHEAIGSNPLRKVLNPAHGERSIEELHD
jgi:hypothetical protein